MFAWRSQTEPHSLGGGAPSLARSIDWGFTDAAVGDGVSTGDFTGLNLGGHVGDDAGAVEANRVAVAAAFGVRRDHLFFMNQVHGTDVEVVTGSRSGDAPAVDAMVTATPGVALAVLVADCTPILLADPEAGVIGVAHAGRKGMTNGVVAAVMTAMRDLGARRFVGAVGPSICGRCYEVPQQMRDEAAAAHPVVSTVSWTGTPALDVAAGVVAQLHEQSVDITWVPGCTRESPNLYSYRRSASTGRQAGVVVMRSHD